MNKTLLGVILSLALVTGAASTVTAQQAGTPSFTFDPADVTVKLNDTFTTKVMMDTAGQSALGGGAHISYDPKVVTILEVKAGDTFEVYPAAVFDNEKGLATISGIASSADDTFVGSGTFGSITWKLNKAERTTVSFVFTPGSTDESNIAVDSGNGDILAEVGELVINPGTETVVTGTTQPVSTSTTATGGGSSFMSGVRRQTSKIAAFFGSDSPSEEVDLSIDPYAPITQTETKTTLATQPTNVKPVVVNEDGSTTGAASGSSIWMKLGLLGLVLLAILAIVIWFVKRSERNGVTPKTTTTTSMSTTTVVSEPMVMATPAQSAAQPVMPVAAKPQQAVPPTPVMRPQVEITKPGEGK